ncbi:hypothetical protein FB446DRAFT_735489 [Lentinula raphanica]|nr:hypothetical protein FB446DRAFT_735489 [Lentinula raphanica]
MSHRSRTVAYSTWTLDSTLSSDANTSISGSSVSTFTGPGSLAGKALFNVGRLTLRGVEQIIISRRLSVIATHFPHRKTDRIAGLTEMYADLLELSRIHLYSDAIRTRALQLLFAQIASRSTLHLINAISVWPLTEVKLLLSGLLECFDPRRSLVEDHPKHVLLSVYQQHLSKWEEHSLAPLINFLQDFATSDEQRWSTICASGFLDLLLQLYISDFADPLVSKTLPLNRTTLSAACNSVLVEALGNRSAYEIFQSHPVSGLWSRWPMLQLMLESPDMSRCARRRTVWASLDRGNIQWRISSIFNSLVLEWANNSTTRRPHTIFDEPRLYDQFVDLLEFSGSTQLGEEISFRALRSLDRLWTRINVRLELSWALERYIEETPEYHARDIFIQMIRQLYSLSECAPKFQPFFDFCRKRCHRNDCPLVNDAVIQFIHRLSRVSRSNLSLRRWLTDGGMAGLVELTFSRLSERGALSLAGGGRNKSSDNSVGGPRYRTLVLSLAWHLFKEKIPNNLTHDPSSASLFFARQDPPAEWDDLTFPIQHHDSWADEPMSISVFHRMEREHKDCVYSWQK